MKRQLALLVAGAAFAAALAIGAPQTPLRAQPVAVGPISPAQAEQNLRSSARPLRDLYRLAEQVKLKSTQPIQRQASPPAPDYKVGDRGDFWIADSDNKNYFSVKATLRYQTEHVHWWVQEGKSLDLSQLQRSADRFEDSILPLNRRLFGVEETPGIDGDPRITVLLVDTPGAAGYYSSSDSYPKSVNPHSNERKLIYMDPESARPGSPNFDDILAHEYQHMIHRTAQPASEAWVDEGMSVLAEKLNGFPGGFAAAFLGRPGTQLNTWDDISRSGPHYGASYLFMDYFFSHYGGYEGMKNYLAVPARDRASFDKYLEQLGRAERFDDVFADWVVANLINDQSVAGGRYGYFEGTSKVFRTESIGSGESKSGKVNQYGTVYYSLTGNGNVELSFSGDATVRAIGTDAPSGSGMWWSNRADNLNTNMTRPIDLTGVSNATLNVSLWWDIEEGYDYAYVEVSDDGGQTWSTLAGKYSTTDNPNGQNLGNGYTNKSGGDKDTAAWVPERFDLSPWAGKKILLRFEYVTDDAYNLTGFAWDNLSIPEIGLADDAEDDAAWTTNGFVRLGNTLPEHFIVQVVTRGSDGTNVRRVTLDANQTGSLTIQGLGSTVTDAWVAISGSAEWTTESVNYTVSVR